MCKKREMQIKCGFISSILKKKQFQYYSYDNNNNDKKMYYIKNFIYNLILSLFSLALSFNLKWIEIINESLVIQLGFIKISNLIVHIDQEKNPLLA